MLNYLRVRGLALLDDVTLELEPGLNVLTGETGAGKSIIVDALALLRGARGRADLVRSGADAAVVDAQFELAGATAERVATVLAARGIGAGDPGSLVFQRVLPLSARSRCFVQAELTTQAVLAEVGKQLIDICSQHEHHSLTEIGRHVELLDAYAGLEAVLAEYAERYSEWRDTVGALEELRRQAQQGLARADFLRFQIEELERVAPEAGEYENLRRRVTLLRGAQRWAEFARDARDVLYEAEDAVVPRLGGLLERARRGAADSERLAALAAELTTAELACEEAARLAERFSSELDIEPGALEQAEERLHELELLRRKHGVEPDELGARLAAMRAELDTLDNAEARLQALDERAASLRQSALELAERLSSERRRAAVGLARALETELEALELRGTRLEARVERAGDGELGPRGLDRVEFAFSANPGEPPASLARVASGGELSRVLLALKNVLSSDDRVSTYVFDEVDAGVGGAVAQAIGLRLRHAARDHQVLCITHLPQIAAFADAHYRVEKRNKGERTITRVVRLDEEQRVEELARMLGGARVSDTGREHARQLLADARQLREPARRTPGAGRASARRNAG
jgi:DNA repair protein RecN (Recombination protein N)